MRGLRTLPHTADTEESGVWLSIGDLMSVLLMIFALLLISALVQISEVQEKSQNNRVMIIKGIKDAFDKQDIGLSIDSESGDISIADSILFDRNDHKLKSSGKQLLDKFIPIYSDVIFQSGETANEVSRIVIEGHSSSEGQFNRNMELSILRSNSVSAYINEMAFGNKSKFFGKVMISGRGPIEANKKIASAEDRKVKFRFQFKDEEFLGNFLGVEKIER